MVRKTLRLATDHPALLVFAIALVLRLAALLILHVFFGGQIALDDGTYHQMAAAVASGGQGGWDAYTFQLYRATYAFVGPVSAIYSVFGPERVIAGAYVAVLGASAAAVTTRVAMEAVARRWALVAGLIVALLPSQILWSASTMKDPSVWLAMATLALVVAVAARSHGWGLLMWLVLASALLGVVGFLRDHSLVVAAWALPIAMVASDLRQRWLRVAGGLLIAVAVPALVGIGPAGLTFVADAGSLAQRRLLNAQNARSAFIEAHPTPDPTTTGVPTEGVTEADAELAEAEKKLSRAEVLETKAERSAAAAERVSGPERSRLERLAARLRRRAAALAAEGETQRAEAERLREAALAEGSAGPEEEGSLRADISHLPRGILVMLFEPVPWVFSGSVTLRLARLEALVWYPILALALCGIRAAFGRLRSLLYPLAVGTGVLLVYALAEGNVGTAFRHRGEFVWVVALLAGLGARSVARFIASRRGDPAPARTASSPPPLASTEATPRNGSLPARRREPSAPARRE